MSAVPQGQTEPSGGTLLLCLKKKMIWGMGGYTARAQSFFYSGHSAQWLFETFKDIFIYSSLLLAGFPMANDTLAELRLLQCDWSKTNIDQKKVKSPIRSDRR